MSRATIKPFPTPPHLGELLWPWGDGEGGGGGGAEEEVGAGEESTYQEVCP